MQRWHRTESGGERGEVCVYGFVCLTERENSKKKSGN